MPNATKNAGFDKDLLRPISAGIIDTFFIEAIVRRLQNTDFWRPLVLVAPRT